MFYFSSQTYYFTCFKKYSFFPSINFLCRLPVIAGLSIWWKTFYNSAIKYIWNKHGNPNNKITVWHQVMHFPSKIILKLSNQYPRIMKTLSRNGFKNTYKTITITKCGHGKEFWYLKRVQGQFQLNVFLWSCWQWHCNY